jgi:hypothetical protein
MEAAEMSSRELANKGKFFGVACISKIAAR